MKPTGLTRIDQIGLMMNSYIDLEATNIQFIFTAC